jgi:hypothetical protein
MKGSANAEEHTAGYRIEIRSQGARISQRLIRRHGRFKIETVVLPIKCLPQDTERPAVMLASMSHLGHSRPGRARSKSGHVRYAPIATKFRSAAKCRDGPGPEVEGSLTSKARFPRCCRRRVGEGSVVDVPGRPQSIGLALLETVLRSAQSASEYCWDPSQARSDHKAHREPAAAL